MDIKMLGSGNLFSKHPSSSIMIDKKILVDVPSGILKELYREKINVCDLTTCIITHLHGDHFLDLAALLLEMYYKAREDSEKDKSLMIVGPQGIEKVTLDLLELAFKGTKEEIVDKLKLKFIEVEDYSRIIVSKDLIISSYEVTHDERIDSYGYVICIGDKKVGFTGDCGMCDGVTQVVEQSDCIFLDTTNVEGTDSHMGIDNAVKLANAYPNKKFIATHMKDETRLIIEERLNDIDKNAKKIDEKSNSNEGKESFNLQVGSEELFIEL